MAARPHRRSARLFDSMVNLNGLRAELPTVDHADALPAVEMAGAEFYALSSLAPGQTHFSRRAQERLHERAVRRAEHLRDRGVQFLPQPEPGVPYVEVDPS